MDPVLAGCPVEHRADGLARVALSPVGGLDAVPDLEPAPIVESGIPRFLVDMDTSTIPLEAGIEDRAISLTKGCYVGQEVIIRVLHRGGGRVAKKLVGFTVEGRMPVREGAIIFSDEAEVGRITSGGFAPSVGAPIAMGYVETQYSAPGTPLEAEVRGKRVPLTVETMPFIPHRYYRQNRTKTTGAAQ